MAAGVVNAVAQENPTPFDHPTCAFLRNYW